MKIKTILLFLALCITMGVSSQGRIEPGNEVAIKLYKEAAKKEKKNPAYSLAMYESLAKDGYAPAQYIMYKKGKGDKWLELAAVGGHYEAAIDNGFLSQRIKQCEQAVERSRAYAIRASNGESISEQEIEMLWDERQVFDQVYRQMESMQGYLFSATIAEDVNFFPPYYKGKKDMQKAQCDLEALCSSCRDRLAQLQMEFGEQMDIIKASAKKTAMTASANGQQTDKTFTVKGVTFVMKSVAGGTFQMGATPEQNLSAWGNEKPAHSVTLSSYYIGQTEVIQALWQAVMGSNPSRSKGNNLPVETVTWDDCQAFITKLNQLTGQNFRLPTEAEWEYAARGGKNSKGYEYSGSKTLGDVAWFYENSGDSLLSSSWDGDKVKSNHCKTHPVATKQPNEIGIYDMCGNVEEWCQDWYGKEYYKNSPSKNPSGPTSGSDRVIRGGCWRNVRGNCRVSARNQMAPFISSNEFGLRLALSQTTSTSTTTQKTAMTASAGTQVRYHDVEYHEAKGKVKSITYPPGPDETEAGISEFTIDGKEKDLTGVQYDSNGYRVSEKYTPGEDGSITTAKIMWKDGRVFKAIVSDKEMTCTLNYKYNAKGELIERSLSIGDTKSDFKYQYSDYKYDDRGNWISRKWRFMNEQWTETRTIVYY